jgi:hypothetical protein
LVFRIWINFFWTILVFLGQLVLVFSGIERLM